MTRIPYDEQVVENKRRLRTEIGHDIQSVIHGQIGLIEVLCKIPRYYYLYKYEPYRGHRAMAKHFQQQRS